MDDDFLTQEAIRIDEEASHSLLELSNTQPKLTCHTSAVEYAKFALGDRANEVLKRLGTARKLYETMTPQKQCESVLSDKPKTNCWLCGKKLFPKEVGPTNPLRTVCEHIFPISLAVFFLDLHRKENPTIFSEESIRAEYDWAHFYCNSVKNDTPFISEKLTPDNKKIEKWVVYEPGIRDMLNNIKKQAHLKGFPEQYDYSDEWFDKQLYSIKLRINSILTTEINTQEAPILTYILGLLKCSDPDRLHKYGKFAIEGKPLPEKRSRPVLQEKNINTKKNKIGGKRTRRNKYGRS